MSETDQTLNRILFLAKICWAHPFRDDFSFSLILVIRFLTVYISYLIVSLIAIYYGYTFLSFGKIESLVRLGITTVRSILVMISMTAQFTNGKDMRIIRNVIMEVDNEMEAKYSHNNNLSIALILNLIVGASLVYGFMRREHEILLFIVFISKFWTMLLIRLYPFCFIAFLGVAQRNFTLANDCLKDGIRLSNAAATEKAIVLYHRLVGLTTAIDRAFKFQNCAFVASSFIAIVMNSYIVYEDLFVLPSVGIMLTHICFAVVGVVDCFYLLRACDGVVEEAERFNKQIGSMIVDGRKMNPAMFKKLNLHLLTRKKVVFCAGGFIELDYTLIHSIFAATTTYLVILMQFQRENQ